MTTNTWTIATHKEISRYMETGKCDLLCGSKLFGSRHWEYPWAMEQSGIAAHKNNRVLDVAPDFTFPYASFLEERHEVTFIDLEKRQWSDSVIWGAEVGELANRSDFRIMDVRDMTFANDTFDTIFCISVLEHIVCPTQDPDHPQLVQLFDSQGARPALKEMKRCLKPQGLLIMTIDIYQGPTWKPFFDQWNIFQDLVACGFSAPEGGTCAFDTLMATPDIFLSDFHGPYCTLGFSLTK